LHNDTIYVFKCRRSLDPNEDHKRKKIV